MSLNLVGVSPSLRRPEMFRFLQTKDILGAGFLCLVSLGRNIRQSLGQFILLFVRIISVALNNSMTLPRTSLDSQSP